MPLSETRLQTCDSARSPRGSTSLAGRMLKAVPGNARIEAALELQKGDCKCGGCLEVEVGDPAGHTKSGLSPCLMALNLHLSLLCSVQAAQMLLVQGRSPPMPPSGRAPPRQPQAPSRLTAKHMGQWGMGLGRCSRLPAPSFLANPPSH